MLPIRHVNDALDAQWNGLTGLAAGRSCATCPNGAAGGSVRGPQQRGWLADVRARGGEAVLPLAEAPIGALLSPPQ